jgi:hypothetical protein
MLKSLSLPKTQLPGRRVRAKRPAANAAAYQRVRRELRLRCDCGGAAGPEGHKGGVHNAVLALLHNTCLLCGFVGLLLEQPARETGRDKPTSRVP